MRKGILAVGLVAAALLACTTTQEKGTQKMEQQRVTNVTYFDLRNCWPSVVDLPRPATRETLIGFLVSSRPELNECFVDPKNRGPEQETRAVIAATVNDQGVTYDVTGQNLTPPGIDCVQKVLKARGGIEPLAQGAQPVQAQIDFTHQVGVSPAVAMGVNEASDAVGTIRLAMPQWCDCFEPWKAKAPRSLNGNLHLSKATPTPDQINFDPVEDPEAQQVQQCVTQKLQALEVPHTSQELKLPLNVLLIHSGVNEGLPADTRPELAFVQLEALRAQRAADVAISLGNRATVGQTWDQLVADYKAQVEAAKKTKKAPSITVGQLTDSCANLLAADDQWIGALEKQLENEQRTLAFAQAQTAKDDRWAEVVTAAQGQVQAAEQDLANARKTRDEDAAACPKKRFN